MEALLQEASQLGLYSILVPEIISALNRKRREKTLTESDYRQIKKQLMVDVNDAVVVQVTPSVIARSVKLLVTNILRAMDSLHIARALEWQAELFATADKRQYIAARNAGLRTEYIGHVNSY